MINFNGTKPCPRSNAHRLALAACSILLVLGALATGCSAAPEGEGPGHRAQSLALNSQQELELGQQLYKLILARSDVVQSGPGVDQVRRVGSRISNVVTIEPLMREINLNVADYQFEWEYSVIEDNQVNAFCLPGGKICVYTGLLRVVRSDDQLAAVLAHEVSHALAHHESERIARERLIGNGLLSLHYDRQQESEADHIGVFLMTFAGYDPQQAVAFWQKMEGLHGVSTALPEILSDHPSDARRLQQLQNWVPMALAAKRAFDEGRVLPASPKAGN
jgi:metalloendopeptidase OMA1, mitochondrial